MIRLPARVGEATNRVLRPRILYFAHIDLPSSTAAAIECVHTGYELARQGAQVVLVVRRLLCSRAECFAFHDLPEHPRLHMVSLSLPMHGEFNDWKGDVFRSYLAAFLHRQRSACTVLLARHPTGMQLLDVHRSLRPSPGMLALLDVHDAGIDRGVASRIEGGVDGLLCPSEGVRRILLDAFRATPVRVVYEGTRIPATADGTPRVAREHNDAPRDLDVLYVGAFRPWQGIETLVRAMALLDTVRLTVVGGDAEDVGHLRALAVGAGVDGRIDVAGCVAPGAIAASLERARVGVVLLSRNTGSRPALLAPPLELFELMRAGVPIVTSDLPAVREVIGPAHAELVPPDDPRQLADAIGRVLDDRTQAAQRVRAAASRVIEFSWEQRARRILEFVHDLQHAHAAGHRPGTRSSHRA